MLGRPVLVILVIAILGWCLFPLVWPAEGKVVIEVSQGDKAGLPPGEAKFQGWSEVDGKRQELAGVAPATFTFQGRKVVYSIKSENANVSVKVVVGIHEYIRAEPFGRLGVHGFVDFNRSFLFKEVCSTTYIDKFDPFETPERWSVKP